MSDKRYEIMVPRKNGEKTYWTKAGMLWTLRDREGFKIDLPPGLALVGFPDQPIFCFPPKDWGDRDQRGGGGGRGQQQSQSYSAPSGGGQGGDDDIPF